MIVVKVTPDATAIAALKTLDDLHKNQVPYATALALTRTGQAAKAGLEAAMDTAFDRPTPFTKNSLYLKPATKNDLVANVKIKDEAFKGNPAVRFLLPEIQGGARNQKGFEKLLQRNGVMPIGWYAIPTTFATLDSYGNVPASAINAILSQLQSARDSLANESAGKRTKRNRQKRTGRYFAVMPDTEHGKLKPGIYERMGTAWGSGVRPIFIYTRKQPTYSARYDFYGIGQRIAEQTFGYEFYKAMQVATATAR